MNKVTRRGFIGSLLVAIPAVRAIAAITPLREAEYVIWFTAGWPESFTITTYTNGTIVGKYGTRALEAIPENGWLRLRGIWKEGDTRVAELKVRRVDSKTIYIDWINVWGPRAMYRDDFWGANTPAYIASSAKTSVVMDYISLKQ